ncbi:MAG: sulfate adenylyltransferase subunit 1 [Flavobacteriia bacterium]|jgi:sulfate adenylyltransferase subunit 1
MELLRFFTAGNVDDGKSTLIGRLLFDSNSISTDIIETLTRQSKSAGNDTDIDLALLTDGLRAEREQGITIDVAYKYFTTEKRKYIIADTPGHAQYTRNMFTGASNTDLAIILVDARNGITDQTKRHSIISSILGIPQILICINKMDLVNYDEKVYNQIQQDYLTFSKDLNLKNVSFIPTSALTGENVVKKSQNLNWFEGPSLFEFLEDVEIANEEDNQDARFQVQYVIRPQTEELHDYRGYAGSLLSGTLKKGQKVQILPLESHTTIASIEKNGQEILEAKAGEPIIIHLEHDLDVSRGSTIIPSDQNIQFDKTLNATICWMDNKAFQEGQKLILQQNSFKTKAIIKEIENKIDIHTFEEVASEQTIQLNEFCNILLKTAENVSFDSYKNNRKTGAFILINENTNNTVAAGVIN